MAAHGTSSSGEKQVLKLGRYEVVRELGKGAMGIVYLAKDPLIGRLVALKTIRLGAHADDEETKEFQQRFIREAQAAGILNHPAIVTVHDIGQDDTNGTSFIAMEFVEGQNLKEVLAQGRALSFDQIADIIAQVADALDFAHSKGIVHRDVKPANIILIEGNRAKITDFGIAKIASGAANLTTTGQFLGTPNYMAPEQIKGAPVDGRTDIFALGICLYECLTRRKPFGGDSLTSISYKIVHEAFPPLHEINPQIPDGYEEVVANCLAKDPAKRYQRARDLGNALRMVIRGERPVRPADPLLADETVVTRSAIVEKTVERDKTPTLEVPFPDAAQPEAPVQHEIGGSTRPASKAAGAVAAAQAAPKAAPAAPKAPSVPLGQQFRRTLTGVRTMPLWKRRIPPALFLGIVAALVATLIGAAAIVRISQPEPVKIDAAAEAKRARMKQLREEANALLRQGNTAGAYAKFEELQRLAPRSPYVQTMLQKLGSIRQQEQISQQQAAQAAAKQQEGIALLGQKQYDQAIAVFQEAATLNPNDTRTADYIKVAALEKEKAIAASKRKTPAKTASTAAATTTARDTVGTAAAQRPTASPAQLTTVFAHSFKDGRIIVRAGSDIVANEQLWSERPARFLRRAAKTPRNINVTASLPPKNADVQIWVTVPEEKINEHRTLPFRFEAGSQHRLLITYNAATKTFNYDIN